MDRKTTLRWVYSIASGRVRHGQSPSSRLECQSTLQLSRGETLVFVLLLSLGLWALIWAAVSLLGADGLR